MVSDTLRTLGSRSVSLRFKTAILPLPMFPALWAARTRDDRIGGRCWLPTVDKMPEPQLQRDVTIQQPAPILAAVLMLLPIKAHCLLAHQGTLDKGLRKEDRFDIGTLRPLPDPPG